MCLCKTIHFPAALYLFGCFIVNNMNKDIWKQMTTKIVQQLYMPCSLPEKLVVRRPWPVKCYFGYDTRKGQFWPMSNREECRAINEGFPTILFLVHFLIVKREIGTWLKKVIYLVPGKLRLADCEHLVKLVFAWFKCFNFLAHLDGSQDELYATCIPPNTVPWPWFSDH